MSSRRGRGIRRERAGPAQYCSVSMALTTARSTGTLNSARRAAACSIRPAVHTCTVSSLLGQVWCRSYTRPWPRSAPPGRASYE